MVTCGKSAIFYTLICFCQFFGAGWGYTGTADHSLSLKTEGSVTVPCHYDRKYTQQRKFWYSDIDQLSTFTNTTMRNLSVIDFPDQSLFTVTMRDLKTQYGTYFCAVEIDGQPAHFFLSYGLDITSVPDLSVVNSSVTGQEGGNISVQCFYSSGYKNKLKQWCRYKDKRCYTLGKTDTSQNASVQISDDGSKSFSVVMTGLTESDSGWYWCFVGDKHVPVQLTVTAATSTTATLSENAIGTTRNVENNNIPTGIAERENKTLSVWLPTSAAVLLLMALICVFIWRWRKTFNKEESKNQMIVRNSAMTPETGSFNPKDSVVYSTINDDKPDTPSPDPNTEMTYSTITDLPECKEQSPAGGTVYSAIAPH
ncbi:CMRF35-like molecule 8 isoform X2 [Xyrauchen texanus]|uniref:CMRF35-like molecule 8 isoform X2 n=1 Tax=Xyrauchen texanus TaxID=154827 RepID=UPI002242C49B|nr:CMRF35-like molecule 8 isoform X2 [Xyrauchen texanus]